ncbi:MAG: hypothetical protein R2867_26165 [Caldilineaceae bacterium]
MNDYIDHLLARSFGPDTADRHLQPRIPGLYEAWHGDAPNLATDEASEEATGDRVHPRMADDPPPPQQLVMDRQKQAILLPPAHQHHHISSTINLYREAAAPETTPTIPTADETSPASATLHGEESRLPTEHAAVVRPSVAVSDDPITPVQATVAEEEPRGSIAMPPPVPAPPESVQPAPQPPHREQSSGQVTESRPTVRVHIGRIEVQLPQPSPTPTPNGAPPPRSRAPFRPPLSLRDYIDQRRR